MAPYHFSVTIHDEFQSVVVKTKTALDEHGFGTVSEVDVAATLKERLGIDRDPYLILGACSPSYARDAIDQEPSIGTLLPCNVVVRAADGDGVVVDFMDPVVMVDLVGETRIHEIADEVRTQLEMTRDAIARS